MTANTLRRFALPALLATALASLTLASLSVGPGGFINPLSPGGEVESALLRYRLARVAAGLIAGLGLGIAGLAVQRVTRNPLADPFLLGVSPGATAGVLVAMTVSSEPLVWYVASFCGGVASYAIASSVARLAGYSPLSLVIAGVAVSYLVYGVNLTLLSLAFWKVKGSPLMWLFGSIAYVGLGELALTASISLIGVSLILLSHRELDVLAVDDDVAKSLGVRCELVRIAAVTGATLTTAAVTAATGPIGFVGVVAPWLARFLRGGSFLELSLLSGLAGGIMVVSADTLIRALFGGIEVPVTAVTALVGAPVLVHLIAKLGAASVR